MNKDLHKRIVDAKVWGLAVYEMPTFCEIVLGKIPVQHVSDLWFVYVPISGVRKNDPRITLVGKILRVSRFDEIPQLWNVIRGGDEFHRPPGADGGRGQ